MPMVLSLSVMGEKERGQKAALAGRAGTAVGVPETPLGRCLWLTINTDLQAYDAACRGRRAGEPQLGRGVARGAAPAVLGFLQRGVDRPTTGRKPARAGDQSQDNTQDGRGWSGAEVP